MEGARDDSGAIMERRAASGAKREAKEAPHRHGPAAADHRPPDQEARRRRCSRRRATSSSRRRPKLRDEIERLKQIELGLPTHPGELKFRGGEAPAPPSLRHVSCYAERMNSPVQASHSLRVFLAIVVAVAVLRYAQDVFVPLALAILLTFLLAPIVERLQRWHVNRVLAVIVLRDADDR